MMAEFQQKDNQGSLFKNTKRKNDQHPLYRGSALIGGQEYWISAWINEVRSGEKAGEKYMSLKLDVKEQQGGASVSAGSEEADGFF
jgi:uncharacterized protein (DUF736 family)